jgi:hypothetical protein
MNPPPKCRSPTASTKHCSRSGSELECCLEELPHSRVAWGGEPEAGMNPAQKCCCGGCWFQESSRPATMATAAVREDNEKSGVMGLRWPRAATMSGAVVQDEERRSGLERRGEERWRRRGSGATQMLIWFGSSGGHRGPDRRVPLVRGGAAVDPTCQQGHKLTESSREGTGRQGRYGLRGKLRRGRCYR